MPRSRQKKKPEDHRGPIEAAMEQIRAQLTLGLTTCATRALEHAAVCSCETGGAQFGSYELLLGLCHVRESASCILLEKNGFSEDQIEKRASFLLDRQRVPAVNDPVQCSLTPRVQNVLRESVAEADSRGHDRVSTLHLLGALVSQRQGVVTVILEWPGRGIAPVMEAINQALRDELQDPV